MNTIKRLAEFEAELSTLKIDLAQLVAAKRGHEAQIAVLKAGVKNKGDRSNISM